MFIDLLKDEDEEWVVYSIIDGHFPSDEELSQVLTASCLSPAPNFASN